MRQAVSRLSIKLFFFVFDVFAEATVFGSGAFTLLYLFYEIGLQLGYFTSNAH